MINPTRSHFRLLLNALIALTFVSGIANANHPLRTQTDPNPDPQQDQDRPIMIRPGEDRGPVRPFQAPADLEETPDQTVLLNTKFAGWQEASENRVGNDLRANWMMVDENGWFEGQVIAAEGADFQNMNVFLMNRGRLVKDTPVSTDGRFQFSNVRQGAYSIVGWGPRGLFLYGLNILSESENAKSSTPTTLRVMAFQNHTTINTDWIRHFAPGINYRVYGRYPVGEGQDDTPSLYGFEGISKFHPVAAPATSVAHHLVTKFAGDRFIGRVHQLSSLSGRPVDVRTTKVMLLKGDEVFASTSTDNYGVFEFREIPDGQYGLVAVGVDGMGMVGIDLGDGSAMNDDGELAISGDVFDFCMISSETVGWLNHYASEVAYRRAILAPRRSDLNDKNKFCPQCQGQGCNTCGGTGICRSKCQSFEDWAARCANQHERTKLGSGFILSELSKDFRRGSDKVDGLFEKAFYGDGGFDGAASGGLRGGYENYGPGYDGGLNNGGAYNPNGDYRN